MFKKSLFLAVGCSALVFGCTGQPEESREIVANLVEAGFPADDVMVVDGKVYVGRDAEVSLAASREMLARDLSTEEQFRTTNLVSPAVTKICIDGSALTGQLSTGLDLAIQNYNELPLTFAMVRTPATDCSVTINMVLTSGTGGSAGYPSGGMPFNTVRIGTGLSGYSVDVTEHVITHELGHTLGFRHSDYYNRSISCMGSGSDEGQAGIGAILVPGTSPTATLGDSLMNSCFRSSATGEFTASDLRALTALYGTQSTASLNFEYADARRTVSTGDWASGDFKAECASGELVTGLSLNPSSRHTRIALCRTGGDPRYPHDVCYPRFFSASDSRGTTTTGDWDSGYLKGECGPNEFIAGVAQNTAQQLTGVLCCQGDVTHSFCAAHVFDGQDSRENSNSGDWDGHSWKSECSPGRYAAGLSRHPSSGTPHALLCCSP